MPIRSAPWAKPAAPVWLCEADVLEGLEPVARAELAERFGRSIRLDPTEQPGNLRFEYTGELRRLHELRSVVSVYLLRSFAVPRPRALLGHQHLTALLGMISTVRSLAPAMAYQTLRLSAAGEDSAVMSRLRQELELHTGLRPDPEEGDLLLRLRRDRRADAWEALVRISPRPLATRAWRVCNQPGALNATLAYAMMRLSAPRSDDALLNICCGSGTLLVERMALGALRSAVGCDIDAAVLECARQNVRAAGCAGRVRLEGWDATQLPLPDASATVICADLPFGQLVGSHRENEQLYPRLLEEAARVAAPAARMLLLTHEVRLLDRVAERFANVWQTDEVVPVRSGGMMPRIYLFRRLPSG